MTQWGGGGAPDSGALGLMTQMQGQVASLMQDNTELEKTIKEINFTNSQQAVAIENRFKQEMAAMQRSVEDYKETNGRLAAQLQHNFDALRWPCLDISETLYNQLRTAPESNLTVKEFVSVQIYGRFAELKAELEEARHDKHKVSWRAGSARGRPVDL